MARMAMQFLRLLTKVAETPVTCPKCDESMTVKKFYYQHAPNRHTLNSRKQCPFCFGRKHWAHGEKNHHIPHLMQCLQQFLQEAGDETYEEDPPETEPETEGPEPDPEPEPETEPDTEDPGQESCECQHFVSTPRQMLGRGKDRLREYVGFYNSLLEKPDMWQTDPRLPFTEASGLGSDVYGMIQKFLMQDRDWFHILVKHDAFHIFKAEMEKIQDEVVLLPFWCLCDGLRRGSVRVQHRHMIVSCEPESSFQHVWKHKIRYQLPRNGRAKKCVPIRDAYHLIRTIVYVSQPKASCDDTIPTDLNEEGEQCSHFHINRPLHRHSIATLSLLIPGGLNQLLLEQNGRKNIAAWEPAIQQVRDKWGHKKWAVPIRWTGWKFLNCKIPLHPEYRVTEHDTSPVYLEWGDHKKWYVHPGEGDEGCSFQRMGDELYVLSRSQQHVMNEMKDMKKEWDRERESKRRKLDTMEKENVLLKTENDTLRKEMDMLKTQVTNLQTQINMLQTQIDMMKETDRLKLETMSAENVRLKRKLTSIMELMSSYMRLENEYN